MPLDLLVSKLVDCTNRKFVIHSDLTIFGRALPRYKGYAINVFRQKLNAELLAIPTFNLHTNHAKVIDFSILDASMGALPLEALSVLNHANSIRLPNPIHSYTFFPSVRGLEKIDCSKSFGEKSVFDYFYENNFLWVEFGTFSGDGLTLFHHLECVASVPYRKKIYFDRTFLYDGQVKTVAYEYYARTDNSYAQNFSAALEYLIDKGVVTSVAYNERQILYGSVKEISLAILAKLRCDPYFLVKKV